MEIINFKTKHSIGDKCYVIIGGEIKMATIVAVVFTADGYGYDVKLSPFVSRETIVRRNDGQIYLTIADAIEGAVEIYRNGLCNDWLNAGTK